MLHHIPNALTFLRLGLAPCLAWALFGTSLLAAQVALGLAIWIECTDWFDGYLARRFGWESEVGKFFDPLADSLYRLTAFVALHSVWGVPSLPMLLVLLYRDQIVAYLRVGAAKQGKEVGARKSGKLKAVFQASAILGACLFRLLAHSDWGLIPLSTAAQWTWWLMLLAVSWTAWSAVDYWQGLTGRTP